MKRSERLLKYQILVKAESGIVKPLQRFNEVGSFLSKGHDSISSIDLFSFLVALKRDACAVVSMFLEKMITAVRGAITAPKTDQDSHCIVASDAASTDV